MTTVARASAGVQTYDYGVIRGFAIMTVIAAVDAEDDETGRQAAEQFVIIQLMRETTGRVVPVILLARRLSGTRSVIVASHVDAKRNLPEWFRQRLTNSSLHQIRF